MLSKTSAWVDIISPDHEVDDDQSTRMGALAARVGACSCSLIVCVVLDGDRRVSLHYRKSPSPHFWYSSMVKNWITTSSFFPIILTLQISVPQFVFNQNTAHDIASKQEHLVKMSGPTATDQIVWKKVFASKTKVSPSFTVYISCFYVFSLKLYCSKWQSSRSRRVCQRWDLRTSRIPWLL